MSNKHTIARTHSKLSYETSKGKRDDEGMRGGKTELSGIWDMR